MKMIWIMLIIYAGGSVDNSGSNLEMHNFQIPFETEEECLITLEEADRRVPDNVHVCIEVEDLREEQSSQPLTGIRT